jgi:lysophospholipase L1-like esterase
MRSTRLTLIGCLRLAAVFSLGFTACLSSSDEGGGSTGSAGTTGSGGTTGAAGTTGSGGTTGAAGTTGSGGTTGTAGTTGSGGTTGAAGAGGSVGGRGGAAGTGTAGTGGSAGGGAGRGGTTGGGGRGGTTGSAGAGVAGTTGSGGSGDCVKGQTHGKDVAILGESFIAAGSIVTELETLAKAAGSLPSTEHYVNNAVSGTTIAGANGNVDQFNKAISSSGTIKYVIMDGGGNDCLQANSPTQALSGADKLFTLMTSKNVEKVLYFFYPDPIGSQFNNLKSCLDQLRPMMKAKCDGLASPKCYWLDLRPTWNGHNEYTSDGIHPTAAGSKATAAAIWPVAVQNCVAQ